MRQTQLLLGVAYLCGLVFVQASEIIIVADSYMPYTGDSAKGETGFMVDIAKAIWEKKGYTVTYQTKSWREALDVTRRGEATAIVGASVDDAPDFIFPKVEQARAQGTFYGLATTTFKYTGPDSLANYCLGIISDYEYNPEIASYIKDHRTVPKYIIGVESNPDILKEFFQMLELKKIDLFLEDRNVVQYFLKDYDRASKYAEAATLKNITPLYIAISPKVADGDVLADLLATGMDSIRSSGELKMILATYGLAEINAQVKLVPPHKSTVDPSLAPDTSDRHQDAYEYTAFGVRIK